MVQISGSIVIARPPEAVFDVVADQRNEPSFNPRMLRAEKVTDGPIGPGTRFTATVRSGGRTADMVVEYTSFDRPRELASVSTMTSAQVVGRLCLEPVPEGTRLWWSWDLRPVGRVRLLRPVLHLLGNRQERRVWSALKVQLESTPLSAPTGPDEGPGTSPDDATPAVPAA